MRRRPESTQELMSELAAQPVAFRVRVEDIRIKPNVPAGMDPCVLLGLVPLMRKTAEDHVPVVVRALTDGTWRLMDGRHRYFAAVIAGRPDVLAVEEV